MEANNAVFTVFSKSQILMLMKKEEENRINLHKPGETKI